MSGLGAGGYPFETRCQHRELHDCTSVLQYRVGELSNRVAWLEKELGKLPGKDSSMTRMRDPGTLLENLDKLAGLGLPDAERAAAMLRRAEITHRTLQIGCNLKRCPKDCDCEICSWIADLQEKP